MDILNIAGLISAVIWIFPAIRQRNTKYSKYFFALALVGPVTTGLMYLHHRAIFSFFMLNLFQAEQALFYLIFHLSSDTSLSQLIFSIISFRALKELEFIEKNNLLFTFFILLIPIRLLAPEYRLLIMVPIHITIIFLLFYRIWIIAKQCNKIVIFDFAIIFYEISIVSGFVIFEIGYIYIYEYLLGLIIFGAILDFYFIIFRADSKYAYISLPDYSAGRT